MGDLISRDRLLRDIYFQEGRYPETHLMRMAIREQPAVDAVKVVRCKDCKHWKPIDEHIPHMECDVFCGAYEHGYPTNADDFCSYGERKTKDAE